MLQTGPVVTLQVAKSGASFHGLAALLSGASPRRTTEVEENDAKPNGNALVLLDHHHGGNRRRKEEMMQRNRQLYRSNPNMTSDLCLEDGGEKVVAGMRGNNMAAISTIDLCTDTFHREYLTLPSQKSQSKNISDSSRPQATLVRLSEGNSSTERTYMRQAVSQENLCTDSGGPLLDKRRNDPRQTLSHYSSFPIRSSVSTHDIICDNKKQQQQGVRTSGAGVWRAPFSQQATPAPSVQPIRIDIPLTRAVNTNPPLVTFQKQMKTSHSVNGHNLNQHIYACPVSATRRFPQHQHQHQQQRPGIVRGQAVRPQVSITPTKHVSFQEPPTQQTGRPGPPREPSDPWRRERQEALEKQHRLQAVELLEQEVHELQAKVKRSAEENERLRKLSLEWQFQKRLREVQQRGDDDEEEEEVEVMVQIQELGTRTQNRKGGHSCEVKDQKTTDHVPQNDDKRHNEGERATRQNVTSEETQDKKIQDTTAPENLTFKERQRLFSLASSA